MRKSPADAHAASDVSSQRELCLYHDDDEGRQISIDHCQAAHSLMRTQAPAHTRMRLQALAHAHAQTMITLFYRPSSQTAGGLWPPAG